MLAIETEALTKTFNTGFWRPRPYTALDALTLSVDDGEVFGFLGPNGAGKSTTLKLLNGLVFPTSGHARVLGHPIGDLSARRRIGFLPENPAFYDHLTAEELLTYFAGLCGVSASDRKSRVSATLDEVGIGTERRMRMRSYSKGMVQRVGVAQAIIGAPDLLFLDEPMSGLDPLGRRELRQLMLRLRDRGCTIFFSSHILADAEALCSRVAILAQGKLMAQGRLSELAAFEQRGWELVVTNLTTAIREALATRVRAITPLTDERYTVELAAGDTPEPLIGELAQAGARLVSLTPVRATLEDYFVSVVSKATPREAAVPPSS